MTDRKSGTEAEPPPKSTNSQSQDYEIGYGKPPKSGQFKPGKSGNPKGGRKGSPSIKDLTKKNLNRKIEVTEAGISKKFSATEIMVRTFINKALRGDLACGKFVLEMLKTQTDEDVATTDADSMTEESWKLVTDYFEQNEFGESRSAYTDGSADDNNSQE